MLYLSEARYPSTILFSDSRDDLVLLCKNAVESLDMLDGVGDEIR